MVWKKQRLLGYGSYGRVHLAVEPAGNTKIAVKSAGIQNSDSLRREGMFLNKVRCCPFIVQCFGEDVSVERGEEVYNLLLEYAPGGTLLQLIRDNGGIPEFLVACYTYQILLGICCIHTLGAVHCDLKPGNVLVFPGKFSGWNRLKLCDLGLAKYSDDETNVSHRGTLQYAPPESLTRKSYTAAKDIWALGCIFVEMLTGKPMWQADNKRDLAMKIALVDDPEIPADLSPPAKHFLKLCLARDPRQRWTARQLLHLPFFQRFTVLHREEDERFVSPLPCSPWSSTRDLFILPSYNFLEYMLPEKDKEVDGSRRRPIVPSGEEFLKQILGYEDKKSLTNYWEFYCKLKDKKNNQFE